ncbi:hypothetical protein L226DRAFT_301023 [Lentinus tigrinus ALCF2SS1-7]|nr:hypothetical protein L226DRAFT_301023 [Lentinus tigrinus ALCF2SS1-7]
MDGPKVWMNGKATLAILQEPKGQTTDHLQAAKVGYASYMGHYGAVYLGAILHNQYVDIASPDIRDHLCDDLKLMLQDPHPQLYLSFIESRYIPDLRRTDILFDTTLTFLVKRWNSTKVPLIEAQRTGTARCLSDDQDACRVRWKDSGFSGAATYIGFTLEADTSPLRAPYVHLEWRHGDVRVVMLFKKRTDTTHEQLSSLERARLGIGMSEQEISAASILSTLQREWVVFDGNHGTDQEHASSKPAQPSETRTVQRRRSRVGFGLQ